MKTCCHRNVDGLRCGENSGDRHLCESHQREYNKMMHQRRYVSKERAPTKTDIEKEIELTAKMKMKMREVAVVDIGEELLVVERSADYRRWPRPCVGELTKAMALLQTNNIPIRDLILAVRHLKGIKCDMASRNRNNVTRAIERLEEMI